jgi:hypothetical protein
MNVKELQAALAEIDGDMLVVLSSDSEGNSFSPLSDSEIRRYDATSTWSGETHPDGLDPANAEDVHDYTWDGDPEGIEWINTLPKVVVLWPTN